MGPNNLSPHSRNSLRMPEQYLFQENRERRQKNDENYSIKLWSKDNAHVIILGTQPDGTFSVAQYDVNGDKLTNKKEAQWT